MPEELFCPNHHQARIVVEDAGGTEVFRKVTGFAPIRVVTIETPRPWTGVVVWKWGTRYGRTRSHWATRLPLQRFDYRWRHPPGQSYGFNELYAIDADGRELQGGHFSSPPGNTPYYTRSHSPNPPAPDIEEYIPPPQPAIVETQILDSTGNLVWRGLQESTGHEVGVACSCSLDEMQCGQMAEQEENDDFCCMSCATLELNIRLAFRQIEALNRRIE